VTTTHPSSKLSAAENLHLLDDAAVASIQDSIARSVCWAMLGGVDRPERMLRQFKRLSDELDDRAARRKLEGTASL
jgi:hypothetical protein